MMDNETIRKAAKMLNIAERYNAGPALKERLRGGAPTMKIDLAMAEERTMAYLLQQEARKASRFVPNQQTGAGLWIAMSAYQWWKCFCGATTHTSSYESSTLRCDHCGWEGLRNDLYLGNRKGFSQIVP